MDPTDQAKPLRERLDDLRVDLLVLREGTKVPMPVDDIDRHLATVDDASEALLGLDE